LPTGNAKTRIHRGEGLDGGEGFQFMDRPRGIEVVGVVCGDRDLSLNAASLRSAATKERSLLALRRRVVRAG